MEEAVRVDRICMGDDGEGMRGRGDLKKKGSKNKTPVRAVKRRSDTCGGEMGRH